MNREGGAHGEEASDDAVCRGVVRDGLCAQGSGSASRNGGLRTIGWSDVLQALSKQSGMRRFVHQLGQDVSPAVWMCLSGVALAIFVSGCATICAAGDVECLKRQQHEMDTASPVSGAGYANAINLSPPLPNEPPVVCCQICPAGMVPCGDSCVASIATCYRKPGCACGTAEQQ